MLPENSMAINKLSIQDVKNILEVVGALEYTVIMSDFDKFGPTQIAEKTHR
jgi:hypothetical protein